MMLLAFFMTKMLTIAEGTGTGTGTKASAAHPCGYPLTLRQGKWSAEIRAGKDVSFQINYILEHPLVFQRDCSVTGPNYVHEIYEHFRTMYKEFCKHAKEAIRNPKCDELSDLEEYGTLKKNLTKLVKQVRGKLRNTHHSVRSAEICKETGGDGTADIEDNTSPITIAKSEKSCSAREPSTNIITIPGPCKTNLEYGKRFIITDDTDGNDSTGKPDDNYIVVQVSSKGNPIRLTFEINKEELEGLDMDCCQRLIRRDLAKFNQSIGGEFPDKEGMKILSASKCYVDEKWLEKNEMSLVPYIEELVKRHAVRRIEREIASYLNATLEQDPIEDDITTQLEAPEEARSVSDSQGQDGATVLDPETEFQKERQRQMQRPSKNDPGCCTVYECCKYTGLTVSWLASIPCWLPCYLLSCGSTCNPCEPASSDPTRWS